MTEKHSVSSESLMKNNNEDFVLGYTLGHSDNKGTDALKDQMIMLHLQKAVQVMISGLKYNRVYEIEFPLSAIKIRYGDSAQVMSVSADLKNARVKKEYMMQAGKLITK